MKPRGTLMAAVLVAAALAAPAAAATIPVSSCAAEVPAHRTGVLTNDVACMRYCTAFPTIPCDPGCPLDPDDSCRAEHIRLGRGARLRLDGHTIVGAYNQDAIACSDDEPGGTCTVLGPGLVQSTKGSAIASATMNVVVRDLRMEGSYGAISTQGKVDARRCVFASWDTDISRASRIRVVDSTSAQGGGFNATEKIDLRNVTTASYVRSEGRIVGRRVTLVAAPGTTTCPPVDAPIVRIDKLLGQGCTP